MRKIISAIYFFCLIFCAMRISNGQTILKNERFDAKYKKFKIFYESELKKNRAVGGSFVFLKDNKILAQNFYGSQNLKKIQNADGNTLPEKDTIAKLRKAVRQLRESF